MCATAFVLAALWLSASCASTPPAPPPQQPAAPAAPISRETYLHGYVACEVREAFQGTAALEPGLHWLVDAALHNRGNRTITSVEVEFLVSTTGKRYRHVVFDTVHGGEALPPGATREVAFPVCRIEDGIAGAYDPGRSDYPAPTVVGTVTDVQLSD